ncbi:GNAT family N-acetyltransferase [Rhodococcus sp. SGAir0479]|uniref:GNAT family N-acetyltransferase n=1 Tax=Rhodococcus sp. SGAir0479 TaxID=2567884 RepID=UPI0010CD64CF|nr:GNAT family N-acetyltransferase [Rhodococcus sp. SGAir0479]QCQ90154.1 N-acetyltransferase [Rhodococcus sp. SGAir0479]
MTDELDAQPEVHADTRRYEIRVGDTRAGFTEFVDSGDQRIFFHTEIDERFSGRGLASTLIRAALEDTVAHAKRIVPICPFVAGFVEKHHDFDDSLDPVTPEAQQTVRESRS